MEERKSRVWLWVLLFVSLLALLGYVFWPRGPVSLPLAASDDPVLAVYRELPCRDELPADFRAVLKFYDEDGVPIPGREYTVTPVSVHDGVIDDSDVKLRTGWYWLASAKMNWCGAARDIVEEGDFYYSSDFSLATLKLGDAWDCFKQECPQN